MRKSYEFALEVIEVNIRSSRFRSSRFQSSKFKVQRSKFEVLRSKFVQVVTLDSQTLNVELLKHRALKIVLGRK
ncbi:MAG: hypothetical protein DRP88_05520 [Candidatus Neomarinimicrobiota bacterium]|nr:MAG: hypothetical protein DRP88_05520 [Candidatus Neomarinimicrobiota bacterium]